MNTLKLSAVLGAALLAGCASQTTKLKFTIDGQNFEMTSPKEVTAGFMSLTSPGGTTLVFSNYVSRISAPSDALAAALDKAIAAYLAKGGGP